MFLGWTITLIGFFKRQTQKNVNLRRVKTGSLMAIDFYLNLKMNILLSLHIIYVFVYTLIEK